MMNDPQLEPRIQYMPEPLLKDGTEALHLVFLEILKAFEPEQLHPYVRAFMERNGISKEHHWEPDITKDQIPALLEENNRFLADRSLPLAYHDFLRCEQDWLIKRLAALTVHSDKLASITQAVTPDSPQLFPYGSHEDAIKHIIDILNGLKWNELSQDETNLEPTLSAIHTAWDFVLRSEKDKGKIIVWRQHLSERMKVRGIPKGEIAALIPLTANHQEIPMDADDFKSMFPSNMVDDMTDI